MKNWEFYREGLKKYCFAFGMKKDNQMCWCSEIHCNECIFNKKNSLHDCNAAKVKWLYQEYKEPVVLTEDEKSLCKLFGRGWIVRDKDDCLHWHERKPYKGDCKWIQTRQSRRVNIGGIFPQCKFDFINWEDEEPWEVKIDD